eukprot:g5323.t1
MSVEDMPLAASLLFAAKRASLLVENPTPTFQKNIVLHVCFATFSKTAPVYATLHYVIRVKQPHPALNPALNMSRLLQPCFCAECKGAVLQPARTLRRHTGAAGAYARTWPQPQPIAPVAPASPTSSELSQPGSIDADDFPVPDMEAWMEDEEDDASSATEEDDYGQDIADSDLPSDASDISDADADADDLTPRALRSKLWPPV